MFKKFVFDEGVPKKITELEFDVFSGWDVSQMSHVEVKHRELYSASGSQVAYPHGPLDSRLGTSSKSGLCETCGEGTEKCVGHFGHVKLSVPVFHFGVFKTTHFTLQIICKNCSRILLSEPDRIQMVSEIRKTLSESEKYYFIKEVIAPKCKRLTVCYYCKSLNGSVKRVGSGLKLIHEKFKPASDEKDKFMGEFASATQFNPELETHLPKAHEDLDPLRVLQLFTAIPEQDRELLSTPHPERFILNEFIVPPLCIRPSVMMPGVGGSSEDDLTIKMGEIVSINNFCREALEEGKAIGQVMTDWEHLQFNTAVYVNSDHPGVTPPTGITGKKIRALCQRLKGKHGRFRGNLSGKRVDFTARTVISPDPNLKIDQVAVPILVAKIMTYPEKVYEGNIAKLRKLIINGNDYPGANYVEITALGTKKKLLMLKKNIREKIASELKVGDIVERHMEDDDIVLFNRQPSLHKLSIMAHRAKVMPWRTFRFNECVCTPYNADFDGDEMNLHLPQTEEARAEAWNLMGVTNNLITSRSGEPLIAAIQDFITASYLLSLKNTFFTKEKFCQLCSYMYDAAMKIDIPPPAIIAPVALYTGKQLFNVLMRPNKESNVLINHRSPGRNCLVRSELCPIDGFVVIRNSELMCGTMDKSILGSGSKKSIFHLLLRDFGPAIAADRMSRLAKLCARYMTDRGFSIGIDDVQPSDVLEAEKQKVMTANYAKCDEFLELWKSGRLEAQPGCSLETTLEHKMNKELSDIRTESGKLCTDLLHFTNSPLIMSLSGSKGSAINISQMIACVGQQTVGGSRVAEGFIDRTLPHFDFSSRSPEAKGFVKNSFYSGMTATEFFFHTMGGREGLVDTAVKTAETGYMARRLMKALEDLSVQYDHTVRNSNGTVVQFTYGGDSLDPGCMEADDTPLEFGRVLQQAIGMCLREPGEKSLHPEEIRSSINERIRSPTLAHCSRIFKSQLKEFLLETVEQIRKESDNVALAMERALDESKRVYCPLVPISEVCQKVSDATFSLTERQLDRFLTLCAYKFRKAMIEPGTAVGALGAQSISEPGTQMTLKTFHFAGVASMNITQGVPRIREIINASKNISTPIINAPLVHKFSADVARVVKGRVERTTLGEISEYMTSVFYRSNCYIEVKVSMKTIRDLQLHGVTIFSIKKSIEGSKLVATKDVQTRGDDILYVYPDLAKMKENLLFYLDNLRVNLPNVLICGIASASRAVISIIDKKPASYGLVVEGDDLRSVMNVEGVVGTETTSNDIIEVQNVLGIEAARLTIINEISMTMKNHGIAVDARHLMLLADVMTFKGVCLGIQRHGIQKMKDSVLMLASFEKTTDHLFDAAVYNRLDQVEGVSECIIVGAPVPLGTGMFKLIKDHSKVPRKPYQPLLLDSPDFTLPFVSSRPSFIPTQSQPA